MRRESSHESNARDLIGELLLDCHNAAACERIKDIHRRLEQGESEVFLTVNESQDHITVVGVRDGRGRLLGSLKNKELDSFS